MPTTTRCKFKCDSKREFLGWHEDLKTHKPSYDYTFQAVYANSPENKEFWKFTPSGKLEVTVVKDGSFELGKEYYIDISECEGV